jgi:NAD(P)-dependent dehydrogenase (short-subunit alcohol dehydrogenase family)
MSLANQRVVIIGGSSGMGLATARAAAAAGAVVTIASSTDRVSRPKAAPRASGQWVAFNRDWNRHA